MPRTHRGSRRRLGAVLAVVLALAALVAAPAQALSTDDKASSFHVDVDLQRDGSVRVTENITWQFPSDEERHGIERLIKVRAGYQEREDTYRVYEMGNVSARSTTGAPDDVSVTEFGAYDRIRVGRADETVSGTHSYVVSYTLANYVNGFEDHAEFYFNLVDPSNESTYERVSATVRGPEPVDRVDCFYGELGSPTAVTGHRGQRPSSPRARCRPVRVCPSWPRCRGRRSTPSSRTCAPAR